MDGGWIKLHRKLLDWEWYDDLNTFRLFFHLLLTVNYEEKRWRGMTIYPGELVTSYVNLAESAGMSVQNIRTALNKLKSTHELTIKSTNKFTLIKINNWCKYQKTTNNQHADQQTTNKQLTTTKEYKEIKKYSGETATLINNAKNGMDEITYGPLDGQKKKDTFGRWPARIAKAYCELVGKRAASAQLKAAKELCKIAAADFPEDTDEQRYEEILGRVKAAKKFYDAKGIEDWNLMKVAENWDKILKRKGETVYDG